LRTLGAGLPTEAHETIQQAITYLENQRAWIGSYEHWRQLGYPVGSGMIERAVALRTDLLNDDWITPQRLRAFP